MAAEKPRRPGGREEETDLERMTVPLLDLKAQLVPLREELLAAMEEVMDSARFILGEKVAAFEEEAAAYLGVRHAVGVSSGTDALLLALMALEVGPGDAVITSDFSFFATAAVIARVGARPVFVDIEPDSFNLDPARLRKLLESMPEAERRALKAIVPVHLFGQSAAMDAVLDIAAAFDVSVIEDAAQSIGAQYPARHGLRVSGAIGAMGCFSFFPSKNLGAFGDAGMVVTESDRLAEVLRIKRVHGAKSGYLHETIGGNFRLDALQAAVLSVKLPHLNRWHAERMHNAERYGRLFRERGLTQVTPPPVVYAGKPCERPHIFNQYTVRAPERDALRAFLGERGIGTQIYYPLPFHRQPCFADVPCNPADFPESRRAAGEVLSLPIYSELTEEMQVYVADQIAEFYNR